MRYRLRTLMIVLALGPPVLAAGIWLSMHWANLLARCFHSVLWVLKVVPMFRFTIRDVLWRLDLAGGYDAHERFSLLSGDSFDGAIHFGEHRMNRKAKSAAVVAIVALAAAFGLGQDKYSDAPTSDSPIRCHSDARH